MRFSEAMAHLSVALRDPLAEFTELLRALREGSSKAEGAERKLSRMAAAEGFPTDWGEGGFHGLLRGKPGPGGGFEATPTVLSFFLTGYLLDTTRHEVAAHALTMFFAAPRDQAVCAKTKQRYFGTAFAAVLADASLFASCADVGVSSDLGMAYLDFVREGENAGPGALPSSRSLFQTPAHDFAPAGTYGVRHLYPFTLRPLFSLIHAKSVAPTRAGNSRTRKRVARHA
jgi:hypothetical protein